MRLGPKLLIAAGIADVLIALAAMALYSLASVSQYTGLVSWVCSLSPGVQPGSPEYEEIRSRVLQMLDRTGAPFMAVSIALGLSGLVLVVAGLKSRNTPRPTLQASQP